LGSVWLLYSLLASPYYFTGLFRTQSLSGEPWKKTSIRRREAAIVMRGTASEIIAWCIRAIDAIGGRLVRVDAASGSILAARGSDRWWYIPERMEFAINAEAGRGDMYRIDVSSDDTAPLPEGFWRANDRNVRLLVAALTLSERPQPASSDQG
jgi:hypothetical protein